MVVMRVGGLRLQEIRRTGEWQKQFATSSTRKRLTPGEEMPAPVELYMETSSRKTYSVNDENPKAKMCVGEG